MVKGLNQDDTVLKMNFWI